MIMFETILENGRNGNEQALMRLYDLCFNAVYNASYNIVLNQEDAEEIAQDAILKSFSYLNNFKGNERDYIALAKTIATNKSIDMFRKHKNMPFQVEIDNTITDIHDNNECDEETLSVENVKKAIEKLPDGYRLVITLRVFDEMEYEDIASALNISTSTVRSQYARGIAKLREVLRVEC